MTTILNTAISTAGTYYSLPFTPIDPKQRFVPQNANVECVFAYGSGGTSLDAYLQTHMTALTGKTSVISRN